MKLVKFWGQQVKIDGNNWYITLRRSHIRKGEPVRVGLNEKLLREAVKARALLKVRVLDKNIFFSMYPDKFVSRSKIHHEPSRLFPGTYFKIYLCEIPDKAFRKQDKEIREDPKEAERKRFLQSWAFQ